MTLAGLHAALHKAVHAAIHLIHTKVWDYNLLNIVYFNLIYCRRFLVEDTFLNDSLCVLEWQMHEEMQ